MQQFKSLIQYLELLEFDTSQNPKELDNLFFYYANQIIEIFEVKKDIKEISQYILYITCGHTFSNNLYIDKEIHLKTIKCEHNHISEFIINGEKYIHKIYGNPRLWMRDVLISSFLEETSFDLVQPPIWAEYKSIGNKTFFYSIFPKINGHIINFSLNEQESYNSLVGKLFYKIGCSSQIIHSSLDNIIEYNHHKSLENNFSIEILSMIDIKPLINRKILTHNDLNEINIISNIILQNIGDQGKSLIHNDLANPSNIIVDNNNIVKIIDYEFSHIGFRCTDILWVYLETNIYFNDFMKGYNYSFKDSPIPILELWGSLVNILRDIGIGHNHLAPAPCKCLKHEQLRTVQDHRQSLHNHKQILKSLKEQYL